MVAVRHNVREGSTTTVRASQSRRGLGADGGRRLDGSRLRSAVSRAVLRSSALAVFAVVVVAGQVSVAPFAQLVRLATKPTKASRRKAGGSTHIE